MSWETGAGTSLTFAVPLGCGIACGSVPKTWVLHVAGLRVLRVSDVGAVAIPGVIALERTKNVGRLRETRTATGVRPRPAGMSDGAPLVPPESPRTWADPASNGGLASLRRHPRDSVDL